MFTACGIMHGRCCRPAASSVHYTTSCKHSLALPRIPKQVELIEIINKPLLLHLVGYLYYWHMGFNSVFKGLSVIRGSELPECLIPYPFSNIRSNSVFKYKELELDVCCFDKGTRWSGSRLMHPELIDSPFIMAD